LISFGDGISSFSKIYNNIFFALLELPNLTEDYISVSQNSFYSPQKPASMGVDGDIFSSVETVYGFDGAWWNIKLSKTYSLGRFVIYSRQDCCAERLGGNQIIVFTGDRSSNRQLCATLPSTRLTKYDVQCPALINGDGVEMFIDEGLINFGEIEIYEI